MSKKKAAKKKVTNKSAAIKKRGRGTKTRGKKAVRLPISAVRVKALAFECESMVVANGRAGLDVELVELIEAHEHLAAAWERGQFLRNLRACAGAVLTVTQAARQLGLAKGQDLRAILDTNKECRDLWEQTRLDTLVRAKGALVSAAEDGNQAAIRAIESFLRDEGDGAQIQNVNFEQVPVNVLADLFGVARQTVHDWYTKRGLGRNGDGTFDLRTTIAWFEEYTVKKVSSNGGKMADPHPLQTVKAEKLAAELEEYRGKLLDRNMVVAGLVARWQGLVSSLGKLKRDIPQMVANQSQERAREILAQTASDIMVHQRQIPDELVMPEPARAKLYELLDMLAGYQAPTREIRGAGQ